MHLERKNEELNLKAYLDRQKEVKQKLHDIEVEKDIAQAKIIRENDKKELAELKHRQEKTKQKHIESNHLPILIHSCQNSRKTN